MRYLIVPIIALLLSACAPLASMESPSPGLEPADVKSELDRFFATDDPAVENAVVERLESNGVSHQTVKNLLLERAQTVSAQPAGLQTGNKIESNGNTYSYALYNPENTPKRLPLLVVLHGMGGAGRNTLERWKERLPEGFIIACPSYPMGAWWAKNAQDLVLNLIRHLRARYPVDYNRVFIAGLSNGAIGAYMIGMFYPDYFAGIVPIAGSITKRYMHFLVNLNNTPVYMIQGVHDPIFPIQLSRRIHKILTDLDSPVVYREHEQEGTAHGGHFLPESEVPGLLQWLKDQRRRPFSRVVRMTREANHMDRIRWARLIEGVQLAALQIPGPENEPLNIKDGNIASLFATYKGGNQFEIIGKNLVEYEIYLSSEMVDFDRPITVTTQHLQKQDSGLKAGPKHKSLEGKVEKDIAVLLHGFKKDRDPHLLFDAKIKIAAPESMDLVSLP